MLPSKEKLEEIVRELARIMRVQDWDIEIVLANKYQIQEEVGGQENVAGCYRNLMLHLAKIYLNTDSPEIDEWYSSIVHEMYHIVTQDWHYQSKALLDFISDETTRENHKNSLDIYYEKTIEMLAKGFVNAYPVTNFIQESESMSQ